MRALIVVDVQKDFCEGGSMGVAGGASTASAVTEYTRASDYDHVVATRDFHIDPGDHFSEDPDFVDSWPRHCVVGTPGVEFHPAFDASLAEEVFDKGHYTAAYSGFEGVTGKDRTTLAEWLGEHGVDEVDVVGIATDHCVRATALDAVAEGLRTLTAGTSSDNTDGVRLSAYVLAARLEQVVAAANDRLATMSDGRYELRYTVDKAAGDGRARSAGGLGMRIVDAWTGVERDPATLSGGETFFSSLALALGLGDVASAGAGGADIDTLFVDEGFGTLDEDTLEEVLDVLDRLRDGGRAVGVVSHVADLRQRVSTRLRVIKGASGSRVEHVG